MAVPVVVHQGGHKVAEAGEEVLQLFLGWYLTALTHPLADCSILKSRPCT